MSRSSISLHKLDEARLETVFHWFNSAEAFGDYDQPYPLEWDQFTKKYQAGGFKNLRVIFKADEAIGWARYSIAEEKPWICKMSIFICLPNQRGQGFGAAALQTLMLEVSEFNPEVCKFEVMTDVQNKPAQAMFEKLGFAQEGLLKRYWKLKGRFSDMYAYALLK